MSKLSDPISLTMSWPGRCLLTSLPSNVAGYTLLEPGALATLATNAVIPVELQTNDTGYAAFDLEVMYRRAYRVCSI